MDLLPLVSIVVILAGFGLVLWQLRQRAGSGIDPRTHAELEARTAHLQEQIGVLEKTLDTERSEKDQLKGGNKEMFARNAKMEAELATVIKERDDLVKRWTKHEADAQRQQKEIADQMQELRESRKALDDERMRVRRDDEQRREQQEAERDRMWNEHEQSVIALLTDSCKRPEFAFSTFTNTKLPDGWDGSLKPDFMIEFLGQYVIFDAKVSKAQNLETYVKSAVKSTVEKAKKNPMIAHTIYLVVPTGAIGELRTHYYPLDDYAVYVISPEAIKPILAGLKRITAYELAEQLDPQERENIVNLLAEFDYHVSLRNAFDLILARHGTAVLRKTHNLTPEIQESIAVKAQQKKAKAGSAVSATELKRIVQNVLHQEEEIAELAAPRAAVRSDDFHAAERLLDATAAATLDTKRNAA